MFSKKSLFVPAALVFTGFFGVSAANAQNSAPNQQCFTVASLQGSYAVINNYGANVALGLQTEYLDGNGDLTRTGLLNQPRWDQPLEQELSEPFRAPELTL
jgi:hypothetical protein